MYVKSQNFAQINGKTGQFDCKIQSQCKSRKEYSLYMLDGHYTDNLNVLIVGTYLEMNNNANGTNNVTYTNEEVHKFQFENWSL